jgi:hypothetical protein
MLDRRVVVRLALDLSRDPGNDGHEFCGDVVEVGEGVTKVKKGQFVSVETHTACGKCFYCLTGLAHICQDAKIMGIDRDGCFAEYVAVPEFNCWIWDIDISDEVAAIQDPFGNAVHTTLATDLVGKTVLITVMVLLPKDFSLLNSLYQSSAMHRVDHPISHTVHLLHPFFLGAPFINCTIGCQSSQFNCTGAYESQTIPM